MLDHVAPIRVSVTDAVAELISELPRVGQTTFRRLAAEVTDRLAVIVRFLAVLELYKQGAVDVEQATTFGELTIRWLGLADDDGDAIAPFPIEEYQG
jgi:segregation and condensation protein A